MKFEIDQTTLGFDDIGAGQPVLFLHAGIANRSMWSAQVAAFSSTHRVICCDLRGFGESGVSDRPFAYADDVAGLLDHLDIEQTVVVGISFGGNVALDFTIEHPERVSGLVLVSTLAGMAEPGAELAELWSTTEAAFERGEFEHGIALEMAAWIDGGRAPLSLDPGFRSKAEAMIREIWDRARLNEETGEERELDPPARDRLVEIQIPVLLIQGDHELPDIALSMARLANGIVQSKSKFVEKSSHLVPVERPDDFNQLLGEFLATL